MLNDWVEAELCSHLLKTRFIERLCHAVSELILGVDVSHGNEAFFDLLADEVVADVDMLRAAVVLRVSLRVRYCRCCHRGV